MVPESLHDFFLASVGASAALIGLLFVAVSVAPERVFGDQATGNQQAFAASAFIILGNILFISLAALLPHLTIGKMIVAMGASGLVNALLLIFDIWRRGFRHAVRGLILTFGSLAIYGLETWWGVQLLRHPERMAALDDVTYVLLVAYAVALARAWELLGGKDYSLTRSLIALIRGTRQHAGDETPRTPSP